MANQDVVEIVRAVPAPLPTRAPSSAIMSIAEMHQLATAVASSGFFESIKTPAQALTLMMLSQAEGIHPIQALRRYSIINGKPAKNADAILADFQNNGGKVTWHKNDETGCHATFKAPDGTEATVTWGVEEAKRAELWGKAMYKKYPRQMFRARTISEGVRMTMAGVVVGMYAPEEVMDLEPAFSSAKIADTMSGNGIIGEKPKNLSELPDVPEKFEVIPPEVTAKLGGKYPAFEALAGKRIAELEAAELELCLGHARQMRDAAAKRKSERNAKYLSELVLALELEGDTRRVAADVDEEQREEMDAPGGFAP